MQKKTIDIATGLSATTKVWKNRSFTWEEFTEKLKHSIQTNETLAQYLKASKKEQAQIKDVGGYVGGYLIKGSRTVGSVGHRQLVTLDIDFGNIDFFWDFRLLYSCAAFIHATHKHSEENPRYRLIIPLDREVSPDEYGAISRKIAGNIGIELFDPTTFDTNRLMFWPSNPKDVPYYWEEQEGDFLNADDVLDSYADWKDISLWPIVDGKDVKDPFSGSKQEDPSMKKGVVGAFCRTYGIRAAIEKFIPEIYIPAGEDRYTYAGGSTSGGVIVYDDLFTFSHHGTDPAGGRTCNAFDLIRIHLFKDLDKHEDSNASFKAMENMCTDDKAVKFTMAKGKYEDNKDVDKKDLEWMSELDMDSKGNFHSTSNNIDAILVNDKNLKGLFSYNTFDTKRYIMRSPPWREVPEPEPMRNVDYSGVRNYIENIYGISSAMKVDDSLALEIERNTIHPIQEYLNGLEWDGKPRIEDTLIHYFGASDTIFTREAFKKIMVAAVARVMEPGCKFDYVLVFVGEQGIKKSMFLNILAKRKWFSDSFSTVHGKEAYEQLQGAWIIEIAELSALRKAEIEAVKHFISKQKDDYRPAYARTPETFKRQSVFFGSTNNLEFLKDPTGNRRFWPVLCGQSKVTKDVFKQLEKEVDQLWAEAVILYNKGEKLYLDKEVEAIARVQQEAHSEKDERMGIIVEYLDRKLPKDWDKKNLYERRAWLESDNKGTVLRDIVCTAEVWCECLGKLQEDMTRYNTREVNDILRSLNLWDATVTTHNFKIYGVQKYYQRKLY